MGDHQRALDANLRALAIREQVLGPDHPDVAQSLANAGMESKHLGHLHDVEPRYQRALAIFVKALGPDNPTTGISHLNYGELLRMLGRLDESAVQYAEARRIITKAMGPDHPVLAHIDNGEGQLALARGRADLAIPLLERAVTEREKTGDPPDLAESRFALAHALTLAHRDPARALALATAARDAWAKLGADHDKDRADADAWLKTRSP
jgi:tetratricopeptide (TPR) repeat protein